MGVALRRQRDGKLRRYWYGEYREADGQRKVVNVGEWRGTAPPSLLGAGDEPIGDAEFEKSREEAEATLNAFAEDARRKGRVEHLAERLIESKTGSAPEYVRLADLLDRWLDGGEYSVGYKGQCRAIMESFVAFMGRRNPKAVCLYQVRPSDAKAFSDSIRASMSPSTYNAYIGILRPAFDSGLPSGVPNPFRTAKRSKRKTKAAGSDASVHRKPFTAEELRRIIQIANETEFMGGLITAAACTGMRRGDVCSLKWADVDLAGGYVTAKANKTGEPIEVPIFAPLLAVLEENNGNGSDYVFPEAARMLAENPDGLTYRFKAIVARALDTEPGEAPPDIVPAAEIEAEGADAIRENIRDRGRRDRMLDALQRYCGGASIRQIEKATGRPRSTVSADLHAVETMIGKPFMRSARGTSIKAAIARVTREDRKQGQRAASVRDWHALRTTFVTMALSSGVPMELIRRLTGIQTVDIVLENYFRPGRNTFRAALAGALPDVLTGDKPKMLKPADELAALAGKVAAGAATEKEKKRLRVLAVKV